MSSLAIKPLIYFDARRTILRTGDIALCRATSLEGRLIAEETDSIYTHATMLGWAASDALMIAETGNHGARLILLSAEIKRYPGCYDVYRVVSDRYDLDQAWSFMCHASGSEYSYRFLWRAWLRRHWHRFPPIPNSDDPQWPRDCSALVHAALRFGNGPQVGLFDCDVSPADLLTMFPHPRYVGTLYPSPEKATILKFGKEAP